MRYLISSSHLYYHLFTRIEADAEALVHTVDRRHYGHWSIGASILVSRESSGSPTGFKSYWTLGLVTRKVDPFLLKLMMHDATMPSPLLRGGEAD
jgi:hypothetical protein